MDLFAHLNYCYPGSSNDTQRCVSQQPQASLPCVAQNIQPTQNQTHPGHEYPNSDASKATPAHVSLNFIAGHDVYAQPRINPTGLRDPIRPNPTGPTKSYHYVGESADLSDQYIPSSSDKITCTDHRPLDEIFGNTRPSSGWQHPKSDLVQLLHIGASRGHSASLLTYPLPLRPHMDGKIQVPLLAVNNKTKGTGLVVEFNDCNPINGQWMEGILMSKILRGDISALKNPNERVLDGLGITDMRFHIFWPNYPPFVKGMSAFGKDGKPITRAELGHEVSLAYADFFYHITSQSIPTKPGPYTILPLYLESPSPGIKYDQLELLTVRNTSRGEWMAEIKAVLLYL